MTAPLHARRSRREHLSVPRRRGTGGRRGPRRDARLRPHRDDPRPRPDRARPVLRLVGIGALERRRDERVGDTGIPTRARRRHVAGGPRPLPGRSRWGRRVDRHRRLPTSSPAAPAPPPLPPRPQRPPRRELPAAPGHEWLAGDFHSHTVHSDGSLEIVELADPGGRTRSRPARRHRPQHGQPPRPSAPPPATTPGSSSCPARR